MEQEQKELRSEEADKTMGKAVIVFEAEKLVGFLRLISKDKKSIMEVPDKLLAEKLLELGEMKTEEDLEKEGIKFVSGDKCEKCGSTNTEYLIVNDEVNGFTCLDCGQEW